MSFVRRLPVLALGLASNAALAVQPLDLATSANGAGFMPDGSVAYHVIGAPRGATVYVFLTTGGVGPGGACAPDGTCLDLVNSAARLSGRADATGQRTWNVTIPGALGGQEVCAQAAAWFRGETWISPPSCEVVHEVLTVQPYGASVYTFTTTYGTYEMAEELCGQIGAHVPMPADLTENAWYYDTRATRGFNVEGWIGMTDRVTDGVWLLWDGSTAGWFNWSPTEPNDYFGPWSEQCVEQRTNLTWNDHLCSDTTNLIACQR